MKFTTAAVATALAVASADANEIDRINAAMGEPQTRRSMTSMSGCTIQPLDAHTLIDKYGMNITNHEHIAALSDAVNGRMALGSHTSLIPEANDAGRTNALVIDGLSGDTNFPHGMLKPLVTVGEINMCEENHGEVYTGVPDGMGAYLVDDETLRIVVQSESYGPLVYETWPYYVNDGTASFTGSHVHYIDFDRSGLADFMSHGGAASEIIKGFGPASTTYFNLAGDKVGPRSADGPTTRGAHFSNTDADGNYVVENGVPTEADWLMQSLCSAHLAETHQWGEGIGFEDDVYITNEEWMTYIEGSEFVGLSMHAMDLANREDWAVGAVTQTGFEKIVELNPQSTDFVILGVSGYNGDYSGNTAEHEARKNEYGSRPDGKDYVWSENIVPARIYVGMKGKMEDGSDAAADDFLARNGLRYGKMYGFATDLSTDGHTDGMFRDEFHKDCRNGARVDGKFVAINWQWDGKVRNYRHDGGWEFQIDVPGHEGTKMTWWNAGGLDESGAKTEHMSPDKRPGLTAFVQGSTAGYFGHYYIAGVVEALSSASNGFPAELNASYFVYQGENDISGQVNLGGAGLTNTVDACPGVEDATMNCDNDDSVKSTFEDIDGLEVISATEGLFAVIQEDSGNELGERMFITKLEHEGTELEYFFVAQSGGKYNTRMDGLVGVPAETNVAGGSHEFSGIIDLSGMLMTDDRRRELTGERKLKKGETSGDGKGDKKSGDGKGDKKSNKKSKKEKTSDDDHEIISGGVNGFMIAAGDGYAKLQVEAMVPINDKLIAIGLQSHNLHGGAVAAFKADRGGQLLAYQPNFYSED